MRSLSACFSSLRRVCPGAAGLALLFGSFGESLHAASSTASDGNVVKLSPFTVSAEEDRGYQATSTLAGTRLKTNLKDLGAAISVITADFLDDTAATDAATLMAYTTNTEVGGNHGNFTGAGPSDVGRFLQPDARTNPQLNQRIRGLGAADLTRGYFLTDIPFDAYNTDRVTISRGPNSLLFGVGSPGGVINNGPQSAVLDETFGQVGVRLDNYGSFRGTIDLNHDLVPERLALRVSSLYQDERYKQEPAFARDERVYAAIETVLARNNNSSWLDATRLRANWEVGTNDANPVEVIPPSNSFHGWFEPLDPSIQQFTGIAPPANVLHPDDGGTWRFQALHDNPIATSNVESRIFTNVHPNTFRHIGVYYSTSGAVIPAVGTSDGLQGYNGQIPWAQNRGDTLGRAGLAGTPMALDAGLGPDARVNQIVEYQTNSPYAEPYAVGFSVPTLQDRAIFDYHSRQYSNGLDRVGREFDAVNVALEQTFLRNQFGVELAYDSQSYETHQDFLFSGGEDTSTQGPYDVYVALSKYLTNGQLNPNLGRAYTRVRRPTQRRERRERETFRATAFAKMDFSGKDGWQRFLGRHHFTFLFNRSDVNQSGRVLKDAWVTSAFDISAAQEDGGSIDHGRRSVNVVAFTSDSLVGLTSMNQVRLHPIDFRRYRPGDTFEVMYVDTSPGGARTVRTGPVSVERYLQQENVSLDKLKARAIAWQSYFFDDHVVGLLGFRKDDTTSFGLAPVSEVGRSQFLPDGRWDPTFTRLSQSPRLEESGDTTTWSLVARYPEKWLGELPAGIDLQVHYARSENFNPVGFRSDAYGDAIGQPGGRTKEYGFLLGFGGNRYTVKFNWFETELQDVSAGIDVDLNTYWFKILREYREAELQGIPFNAQLAFTPDPGSFPIQSYQQFHAAALNLLPARILGNLNPRQVDSNGDGQWDRYETDLIPNQSAVQDRVAEGFEVEFVANPTPSLRLMANISRQESLQLGTAKALADVVEAFNTEMERTRIDELREDGLGLRAARPISGLFPSAFLAPVRATKALDGTVSNEQRKWRVSVVGNYDFQQGRLKGFNLGGAVRWEDKAATGYVTFVDSSSGLAVPDVTRPHLDDGVFSGDFWVGYERPVWRDRFRWRIQLNVRNLIGETDDIPVRTNPDGNVAVVRIPNPRTVYLTNTFSF